MAASHQKSEENRQPKKRKENKKEDKTKDKDMLMKENNSNIEVENNYGGNNMTEELDQLEKSEPCYGNFNNSQTTKNKENNPIMELAAKKEKKVMDYNI